MTMKGEMLEDFYVYHIPQWNLFVYFRRCRQWCPASLCHSRISCQIQCTTTTTAPHSINSVDFHQNHSISESVKYEIRGMDMYICTHFIPTRCRYLPHPYQRIIDFFKKIECCFLRTYSINPIR